MTIITLSDDSLQTDDWRWHLQHAVRDMSELGNLLNLDLEDVPADFPLLVPRPYLSRILPGQRSDPLLLQVLPRHEENVMREGFVADPLAESSADTPAKGLLQKYNGRALVITTGACAVNCRYCFRRHFPYDEHQPSASDWQAIVSHLGETPETSEIILSGGDPLVLKDSHLARMIQSIETLNNIQTIRIHTRLPIVIPERIGHELIDWIQQSSRQMVFVLHINHPNEIDDHVITAMEKLKHAGVTLLNQSVLLKEVNDSAEVLTELSRRLFSAGVLPYYLHLLDPVSGAAHFEVDEEQANKLMKELCGELPGYLVPRLVREVPGKDAKQLLYST